MNKELREKIKGNAEVLYCCLDNECLNCVAFDDCHNYEKAYAYTLGAESMYAELSPIVEWVSVKDRKPTNDTTVNIRVRNFMNHIVATALYSAEENKWFTSLFHDEIRLEVTHWKKIEL